MKIIKTFVTRTLIIGLALAQLIPSNSEKISMTSLEMFGSTQRQRFTYTMDLSPILSMRITLFLLSKTKSIAWWLETLLLVLELSLITRFGILFEGISINLLAFAMSKFRNLKRLMRKARQRNLPTLLQRKNNNKLFLSFSMKIKTRISQKPLE